MMDTRYAKKALAVGALALSTACGSDGGDTAPSSACDAPLAEAGASETLPLGSLITLNGSGSTACSDYAASDISYTWTFDRIPSDSSVDENVLSENGSSSAARPSFVPDAPGEYVISLRVSDPTTASEPDYVVITIVSDDMPPLADCGADATATVGLAASLDGRASYDPEGARITYNWAISSTPECSSLASYSLFDQGTPVPSIVPDCQGLYVLSLVVSDGLNWSEPDYCMINAQSDNARPRANAGTGGTLPACTGSTFDLNGWESYDPDGDPITYAWSVVSAPPGADPEAYGFVDATVAAPTFTWDKSGEWTFQLQVSDPYQASVPDLVTYVMGPEGENNSPTANAGGDQTVTVVGGCSYEGYSLVCEPCAELLYAVDGSGSTDPDGDTLQYEWTDLTGDLDLSGTTTSAINILFPERPATLYSTYTETHELELHVNDCSLSDHDRVTLTYTCRGEYGPSSSPF
ncbi:MAG: REJ domain-containing protein [Myxococcota bacterium]|nr:REJ domain-containing protein [Myxococcota bacterium]MEC9388541.1 REJ domain-containing protein [Myxococcota bacterium]